MIIEFFKSLSGTYTIIIAVWSCLLILFCIVYKIRRERIYLFWAACVGIMLGLTSTAFYINWNILHGIESLKNQEYKKAVKHLGRLELFSRYSSYINRIPGFNVPKKVTITGSLGTSYYHLSDYNKAIYYLSESLLAEPDEFLHRVHLAHSYFYSDETQKAYKEYEYVTSHQYERKDFVYFFNLGKSYGNLKLYEKAANAFIKALELLPNRKGLHIYIAGCYSMQNKKAKALEHMQLLEIKNAEFIEKITKDRFFEIIKNNAEFKEMLTQISVN